MSRSAAQFVCEAAAAAISERGRFMLALSGGRTPRRVYEILSGAAMPWQDVHLFWGDERCVPATDPSSNYRMAEEVLLSKIPVPPENVHAMPVEGGSPDAAAQSYEDMLRGFFPGAVTFDLILLGVGPDGHTASLFPGSSALSERKRWVVAVDGKEGNPPVPRLTLTLPAINASRRAAFLAAGLDKKEIHDKISTGADLPAARVAPRERLLWFLSET